MAAISICWSNSRREFEAACCNKIGSREFEAGNRHHSFPRFLTFVRRLVGQRSFARIVDITLLGGQADYENRYEHATNDRPAARALASHPMTAGDQNFRIFEIYNLAVVNDDVELHLRLFDTTLAAFQADASDYAWGAHRFDAGSITSAGSTTATEIDLLGTPTVNNGVGNAAGEKLWGTIRIVDDGTQLILMTPRTGVLQVVQSQDSAVATGTTTTPNDDTIPQNTEGDEYMTLAITPKSASSRLLIQASLSWSNSAVANRTIMALFRDSIADALAAVGANSLATALAITPIVHDMASPGVSATTFKVRIGPVNAATITFNGESTARRFGGIIASSIIITEYI